MIQTKHFSDTAHMVQNAGYHGLDKQINDFISGMPSINEIIDIKYSSVFNELLASPCGVKGIMQYSALLIYKTG